jgi:hypothetical protein
MKTKTKTVTLTFAELESLAPADLYAQGATIPKQNKAISKAQETFVGSLHVYAKVVAALKRLYIKLQNEKAISGDLPFSSSKKEKVGFFEQNCKGELPGRVESLAGLFNSLVLTLDGNGKPLLAEEFFDACKLDWLEKANAIVNQAMKEHSDPDWKTCDDVLDTINALSGKPHLLGDTAGSLKEIREGMKKNAKTGDGEESEDGETAQANDTSVAKLTLDVATAHICALFMDAGNQPKEKQAALCAALFKINDAWANNDVSEHRRAELDKQVQFAMDNNMDPAIEVKRGEKVPA